MFGCGLPVCAIHFEWYVSYVCDMLSGALLPNINKRCLEKLQLFWEIKL